MHCQRFGMAGERPAMVVWAGLESISATSIGLPTNQPQPWAVRPRSPGKAANAPLSFLDGSAAK
jgi:hypothetical protein